MNLSNLSFFSVIGICFLILYSCANQGTPTGGPRDTIPPTVVISVPEDQSLNYNGDQLYFLFDERIDASKLKQQLVITPNTNLEYSYVVKKDELIIKLETDLEDSITYTFNFLDGVTDITEKNPVQNFKLAFSTGPFIDSIYIDGTATELLTGKPATKYIVGLYDATDTINIFNGKPKYFTTLGESSNFRIENIKIGKYLIYAWKDDNRNLKLETEKEAYAFKVDTLDLNVSLDSVELFTIGINTKEPDLVSSRIAGRYFDAKYNKQLLSYNAIPADTSRLLPNQLINPEKLIRFYNSQNIDQNDSITYYLEARDSLGQFTIDTVHVKFRPTNKKSEELKVTEKVTDTQVSDKLTLQLEFSKPVATINRDSIRIALDTLAYIDPLETFGKDSVSSNFTWNTNKTALTIDLPVNWQIINDSIAATNSFYQLQDSLSTDTTRTPFVPIKANTFSLVLEKGAVISVEKDTLTRQVTDYVKQDPDELGMFILTLDTQLEDYWIELYNKDTKKVEKSYYIKDQKDLRIPKLKPATYAFIIKVDENKDGMWSYGNILENSEPEPVIHTGIESALRANFEVSIKLTF